MGEYLEILKKESKENITLYPPFLLSLLKKAKMTNLFLSHGFFNYVTLTLGKINSDLVLGYVTTPSCSG